MKQLQSFSIVAPGFFGLNSQDSGITIESGFATVANNLVIDKYGRLGARKGWTNQSTSTIYSTSPVRFLAEHVDADDVVTVLSAGNSLIGKGGVSGGFTDITPSAYTVTDNEWSSANLLGLSLLTQTGHEPLVYDNTNTSLPLQPLTAYTSTTSLTGFVATYADLASVFATTGDVYYVHDARELYEWNGSVWVAQTVQTQNFGSNFPKSTIAAYGRFWAFNESTVFWSTDIADANFPCFCGGTSGTLNISSVLPKNVDKITGLAIHNDFLIIFCQHNVVIYQGAINPIGTNFGLYDVIAGVGCVATRSIQSTGNDLIFLSDTGVRSLGRLITEKSLPMRELTRNVQDELLADLFDEAAAYDGTFDHVCSVYSEAEGFYLLALPALGYVYCLDMRKPLQDGSAKITKWSSFPCYSLLRRRNRDVLLGKGGVIGKYTGYLDNGSTFPASFLSSYNTLQSPTILKILKKLKATIVGGSGQSFFIKVVTDFGKEVLSYPIVIETTSAVSEFGVAEYNVGEYSGVANDIQTAGTPTSGSGSTIQIGFDAVINNQPLSVQKIDLLFKTGRNV